MRRRDFLVRTAALGAAMTPVGVLGEVGEAHDGERRRALRIGLTPVFLDDQAAFLNRWRDYLSRASGYEVVFVQRSSYREISEQIASNALDVAWMCGYPYVMDSERLRLLAVPLHLGRPAYRSYLITPEDAPVARIEELEGKVFAFSDPNSFSGSLYPRFLLHHAGHTPDSLFRRSFFTWSHRKVVEAVAVGLADGGAVAGYVWETLDRLHPEITRRTRVVSRSPSYGFPPFVARRDLPAAVFSRLQSVFFGMRDDDEGLRLLTALNLDGFVPGTPEQFSEIREMARLVDRR